MRARAEALAGLHYPKTCEPVELSEIRRVSGGVGRQKVSRADSNGDREGASENEKTPSEEGVSSFLVTDFQEVSVDVMKWRRRELHPRPEMRPRRPLRAQRMSCLSASSNPIGHDASGLTEPTTSVTRPSRIVRLARIAVGSGRTADVLMTVVVAFAALPGNHGIDTCTQCDAIGRAPLAHRPAPHLEERPPALGLRRPPRQKKRNEAKKNTMVRPRVADNVEASATTKLTKPHDCERIHDEFPNCQRRSRRSGSCQE